MILFKEYHAKLILEGKKTQTRRLWKKPRVKIGNIYKAKTNLYSKQHFALLKITGLRKEKLGEISPEDVKKEGYATLGDFIEAWTQIHGLWDPELEVYVIDFEVIEPFHKLLKDFPQGKWLDAADGCEVCGAKAKVMVEGVFKSGAYGWVRWVIPHKIDCPESEETIEKGQDAAGWEFMPKPFTLKGKQYYPLKSRANIGPCLECGKFIIGVPLILFIDKGRGGQLDFCWGCTKRLGLLEMIKK